MFDRGIVSEENLAAIRKRGGQYLTGTPRSQMKQFEAELLHVPAGHFELRMPHLGLGILRRSVPLEVRGESPTECLVREIRNPRAFRDRFQRALEIKCRFGKASPPRLGRSDHSANQLRPHGERQCRRS